ncbi:hypothetical protein H8R18_04370 [Nanchangia anserum]|uniref:Probable replication restart protein PriA n=1 Tax=Nanchangia anserum TaxID=2692125 RepID=A0A8I0KN15_9ACTO|nr:hypothetical protein [Nanchangia anserum]MBD3688791.1 hypothetical protein [Nanchangia anserum]QOX82525.1 hypothetical protein H8R18_04370 [Nanchangia anserum]
MSASRDQLALWAPTHAQRTIDSDVADPVARVLLDRSEPHLDHPFDYLVPAKLAERAQPGRRARVRLAGKLVDAWILERTDTTTHTGTLQPLSSVSHTVSVLTEQIYEVAREVAHRYAGVTAEVLAQAIPPRHGITEEKILEVGREVRFPDHHLGASAWETWRQGQAFLAHLAGGDSPRAVWQALPGLGEASPEAMMAAAVEACLASGRSVIVMAPTIDAVERAAQAVRERVGQGEPVEILHSRLAPSARYGAFMRALLGQTRVVIGMQSAVYAPLARLGLIVMWDDGADAYASRRAPYVHARVAAVTRARHARCGLLIGSYARTCASQLLVESGWAHPISPPIAHVRAATPQVDIIDDEWRAQRGGSGKGRIPARVQAIVREALRAGPVLVHVPRAGYIPVIRCGECGASARCGSCGGPLAAQRGGAIACAWCGRDGEMTACAQCGKRRWRAGRVGSERTAEELGRAFAGTPVISSSSDAGVIDSLDSRPRLIVATAGAEPHVEGGYAAGLILDAHVLLARPELWVPEEALRRWFAIGALVRPTGRLLIVGDVSTRLAQTCIRWDGTGLAASALEERRALAFPPVARLATVSGDERDVADFLARLDPHLPVLGPLPSERAGEARAIVRAKPDESHEFTDELLRVAAARSISRLRRVRIQVDPATM